MVGWLVGFIVMYVAGWLDGWIEHHQTVGEQNKNSTRVVLRRCRRRRHRRSIYEDGM